MPSHLLNELAVCLAHALQEQVMARQAAAILLEQVQADGQDAAQHVSQAATQLHNTSTHQQPQVSSGQ